MIKKIINFLLISTFMIFLMVLITGSVSAQSNSSTSANDSSSNQNSTTLGLQAAADTNVKDVKLTWQKQAKAAYYKVSKDGSVLKQVTITTYTDSNVSTGDHAYVVKAYDAANKEIASASYDITKTDAGVVPKTVPISSIVPPKVSDINFSYPGDNKDITVTEFIGNIITWIFGFIAAAAVIAIVYSGLMYITSGGDPAKAESAKKNLTWAIIGLVLAIGAYLIVSIVINELNTL